jgi:hypothetical protein
MELNNQKLPEWLQSAPAELYPQGKHEDFYTPYISLKTYLNDNIHKEVTIGANLVDPDILLNDHGIEHIETVISRASYLVACSSCNLTPYETYILLCCIQLHDVGNILGRYKHEKNSHEIMKHARGICGRDTIEAILIKKIAETHGGKLENGDKDKITSLNDIDDTRFGEIRSRLIASILRFADELADDRNRANTTLLNLGKIPRKSEVFHAYASCLESVKIDHSESLINLQYYVPIGFTIKKFGKFNEETYLIDEIYDRLMKMHHELMYCQRFTKGHIDIQSIRVDIRFYNETEMSDLPDRLIFDVKETGYPSHSRDIYEMCPELSENGTKMNGEYFYKKISELNEKSV